MISPDEHAAEVRLSILTGVVRALDHPGIVEDAVRKSGSEEELLGMLTRPPLSLTPEQAGAVINMRIVDRTPFRAAIVRQELEKARRPKGTKA